MLVCKKCEKEFPVKIVIDGVERNLQRRQFCLECSPFGQRNTRDLTRPENGGICACGKEIKGRRKPKCRLCYWREKHARSRQKVYDIVGTACWKCGFDGGMEAVGALDFHHMKKRSFHLTSKNITNKSWQRVFEEMQKCANLCCRCHRLVHIGIIKREEITKIYENKWSEINNTLRVQAETQT